MAYVTLDKSGNITGQYANQQPQITGFQQIDDADPRLAMWQTAVAAQLNAPSPITILQTQVATLQGQVTALTQTLPS